MTAKTTKRSHLWGRDEDDWYVEPEKATESLLTQETFFGRILDPACGGGNILRVLRRNGHAAFGSDVVDRGVTLEEGWLGERDFLANAPGRQENIVCNPPFFRAKGTESFIRRALDIASRKVAIFTDLKFLAGQARANGLFTDSTAAADLGSLGTPVMSAWCGAVDGRRRGQGRNRRLVLARLGSRGDGLSDAAGLAAEGGHMIPVSVMRKLNQLAVTDEQAELVYQMIYEVEQATKAEAGAAIDKRRASDRERKQRQRLGAESRDVTGQTNSCHVTSRPVTGHLGQIPPGSSPNDSITLTLSSSPQSSLRSESSSAVADDPSESVSKIKPKRQPADDEDLIQDLVAIWNEGAASIGLSQVRDIPPRRLSTVRARIRDFPTFGFDDPKAGMRRLMAAIRGSPFLSGEQSSWKANFDFAMGSNGFTKIMEGNYESQGKVYAFGGR